ncbi:MAG: ATP synthase F0 subunit C [Bacilli bacterium]
MSNLLGNLLLLAEKPSDEVLKDTAYWVAYWQAQGMKYVGIGLMLFTMALVSLGEGFVCMKGVEGVAKNPEADGKIRTTMIIGTGLVETCAIYTLVLAILLIFVV